MPTSSKSTQLCLPHNQSGLVGINRNSPCDGYFGCDEEEDKKALLSRETDLKNQHYHLPWIKRKSPPVLSFFKRMASIRKQSSKLKSDESSVNRYRTLPDPETKSLYFGYKCFPFDSRFASLRQQNYCCDGYFGCPPPNKN